MTCKVARGADERRHGPAPLRPVGFDDIWSHVESEDAGHCPSGRSVQRIGRLDREPLRLGATDAGVPHRPAGPSAAGAPPAIVRDSPA